MSKESVPVQDAPAPFSGAADPQKGSHPSDFVLRSSDGVDFHVHREILKFASDCFDGMFTIPGGDADPDDLRRDGKPVLVLPEPETVLFRLLRLAYPAYTVADYTLEHADLDNFFAVYKAAGKYQFLRVQYILEEMLDNSALMDMHPHRLFAITRLCNLLEPSRKAALATLKSPLSLETPYFPEMKLLSWEDGHTLYRFHRLCSQKAGEIVEERLEDNPSSSASWIFNDDTNKVFTWWNYNEHSAQCDENCRDHYPSFLPNRGNVRRGEKAPVQWFKDHVARLAVQLRLCPSGAIAKREARSVASRLILDACHGCSLAAEFDLTCFARQLAKEIDDSNNRLGKFSHLFSTLAYSPICIYES
ncbi:hypothetical protein B0H13DRAFT_1630628 [Mycena leptocephala]|nr:hypothetical protein B0H13DRAFT_1630628 [Mycena leptocephala]